MSQSIPASKLVAVQPGVLGTGGSPLTLNSVFGTDDTSVPVGTVYSAPSLLAVQNHFGVESQEALMASVYFTGFTNCTRLPGTLYFAQYNTAAVAAYLRSGSFASVPLATLQALSGTLILSIDGRVITTPNIDLSSATSFSNVAALVQAGIQGTGASFRGTASITSDVMTVTAVTNGVLKVGDVVHSGANSAAITSLGTGTGGIGTYNITIADAASGTVTVNGPGATVIFDSQLQAFTVLSPTTGTSSALSFATGTLAAGLELTSATGAVLSPGAAPTTPQAWLNQVATQTLNFALITTTFAPDQDTQVAFAAAVNTSSPAGSERLAYVGETTDVTLGGTTPAPATFPGRTLTFNGRIAVYSDPTKDSYGKAAAFVCGAAASINWSARGGRITFAGKRNSQLVPSVVDETFSDNLDDNNTNYYAAFATANAIFQQFQEGQISGDWDWIDEYVNQIYLNSQFQLALMTFLQEVNADPYNEAGYGLIRSAMLDPINEATNNGTIRNGVVLSQSQIAALTAAAGTPDIVSTLFSQGWYLQILDPGAQARGARTSPDMTFWYTDGGAIQKLNLASIDVQ